VVLFQDASSWPYARKALKAISFQILGSKRSVEEEMDDPERLRRTRAAVLGIAIILTLFGLIMLAPALYWAALSHWHEAIPLLLIGPVACIFAFNFYVTWLRLRQRDGDK
jgi:O-antigen/teichoic acid export membrane protein